MTSMCVLGLRPVTLLGEEELSEWGNDKIKTLVDDYGHEQHHEYLENGEKKTTKISWNN